MAARAQGGTGGEDVVDQTKLGALDGCAAPPLKRSFEVALPLSPIEPGLRWAVARALELVVNGRTFGSTRKPDEPLGRVEAARPEPPEMKRYGHKSVKIAGESIEAGRKQLGKRTGELGPWTKLPLPHGLRKRPAKDKSNAGLMPRRWRDETT